MKKNDLDFFLSKISMILEIDKKKISLNQKLEDFKTFDSIKVLEFLNLFETEFKKKIKPNMLRSNCSIKKLYNIYNK